MFAATGWGLLAFVAGVTLPFAEFLMASEDWKMVLLAVISAVSVYMLTRLEKMKTLVNGRMDEMKKQERAAGYADGFAAGVTKACQAVGDKPNIPASTKELADAVADTMTPPVKKAT